jgi:hypothetical protein
MLWTASTTVIFKVIGQGICHVVDIGGECGDMVFKFAVASCNTICSTWKSTEKSEVCSRYTACKSGLSV